MKETCDKERGYISGKVANGEGGVLGRRLRVQKMGIVGELRVGGGHGAKVATCHMETIFKVGQFNQK